MSQVIYPKIITIYYNKVMRRGREREKVCALEELRVRLGCYGNMRN